MKKLALIIFLGLCINSLWGQTIREPYDFTPITENGKLKGVPYKEKVERLQIPEDILHRLSTEALVETCLNYRLFYVIKAFNNIQEGVNQILGDFNGFGELLERDTAGDVLVAKYIDIDPLGYNESWSDLEKGYYLNRLFRIEIMLAQRQIMDSVSEDAKERLFYNCQNKIVSKRQGTIYSSFNIQFVHLVIARIIKSKASVWNNASPASQQVIENALNAAIIPSRDIMGIIENMPYR